MPWEVRPNSRFTALFEAQVLVMAMSGMAVTAVASQVRESDSREGVLNWFSARATNGFLEGMNSVIQSLKRASRGFRNVGYFTTTIFLRLGRLDFSAQLASGCGAHWKQQRALISGAVPYPSAFWALTASRPCAKMAGTPSKGPS